ncbi:MAG: right-handed parallel beta-helix repeat-containing protein [Chloroflexi bacterium]|nr:right-handed parallel beta-helix repeat-containing protein [Chloroflexota bacterium]MCI0574620.1 right-handed parallel beta-helix repeat-containing protein [Chloroflexota bacterium]MCI0644028.1 right-handed parallel beta-helix repeat-containing protein [Chloroflexota bacterium]MCI0731702.1 right-handed parallel beta-helix repeat-containing protein [Chloroflexota bacterium]
MSRIWKWLGRIVLFLLLVIVILAIVAAVLPVPADPEVPAEQHGAGASSVEPSYSGLQRAFPPLNEPADNPTTDEKVELGRLLFFDPVLSAGNDITCATCHHPDYGFSDGLPQAVGAGGVGAGPERNGGVVLARSAPSLWNAGYAQSLFWDGRESALEAQLLVPLTHADEMAADSEELLAELAAIPEYQALFAAAFGDGEAITLENVQRALAAFERTLVSDDSPFDRYAAGDFEALTPAQRRGLVLFRSAATRCFECHAAPTFATNTYRVIGVPAAPGQPSDPGRAAVANDAPEGAFRVPSLRNVALTAPYMHNGQLATLEEVIDFYAQGGGRADGAANVDHFILGFELTGQEKADLIAFLYALTDESNLPAIPEAVPSGLPVVPSLDNPARELVAQFNTASAAGAPPERPPMTIRVQDGETIQAAVDRAQPGDTIEVPYGLYYERVVVDMSDITLAGIPNEQGEWPILDGRGELPDGIISSGNNFTVGNFHIRNFKDNGVLVEGATGVHFHDIFAENTGTYGVYPVQSTGVLIERVEVTGVDDAGIYAGQCENVVVRDSVAYGNVIGIELENTLNGEVYNNHTYDNSTGIFVVLLPNLTSKISAQTKVYNNISEDNNHPNFAPEGATARLLPPGVGILLLATDHSEVYNNTLRDNKSSGIAVFSLTSTGAFENVDVGPIPEHNWLHDNVFENNGFDPDPYVADLGIPAGDILWDVSGMGNVFDEPDASGGFPPLLPGSNWPGPLQKVYWRALNTLIGLVS